MKQATRQYLLKLVQDNYRSLATKRSELKSQQKTWPLLAELAQNLKSSEQRKNILDIGCGQGRLAQLFSEANVNYLGIDNCPELISTISAKYKELENIHFKQADILRLNELAEIGFDYVFSLSILHHIPSSKLRLEALKQLKNKLRPGAQIYLSVRNLWADKNYRRSLIKFFVLGLLGKHNMDFGDIIFDSHDEQGKLISQGYYHAFRLKELKELAKRADLQVERLYKDEDNYYLVMKK